MPPSTRSRTTEAENTSTPVESTSETPTAVSTESTSTQSTLVNESSEDNRSLYQKYKDAGLNYTYEEWKDSIKDSDEVRKIVDERKDEKDEKLYLKDIRVPKFDGKKDYLTVQSFITNFDEFCDFTKTKSGRKLRLNISKCLTDDAEIWWNIKKKKIQDITIKDFVKLIQEHFIPGNPLVEAGKLCAKVDVNYNEIRESTKSFQTALDLFEDKNLSVNESHAIVFYCEHIVPEVKERLDITKDLKSFNTLVEAMVRETERLKEKKGADYIPTFPKNKSTSSGRIDKPYHTGTSSGRIEKPYHARNSNYKGDFSMRKFNNNKIRPNNKYWDKKCFYCHKSGHIEFDCREKKRKEQQSKKDKGQH